MRVLPIWNVQFEEQIYFENKLHLIKTRSRAADADVSKAYLYPILLTKLYVL